MSIKEKPIAVIGAGAWGTALALLLARNKNPVRLWGNVPEHQQEMLDEGENARFLSGFPFPKELTVVETLSEALDNVRDILIVVPSNVFREVLVDIAALTKEPRLVWGTKGLDPTTQNVLHYVVAEIYSEDTPVAVLSGPSFAKEVAQEKPTAVSLAGNNDIFLHDLMERLQSPHFYVYQNTDIIGLQLCGVLKNILAIATGIADGGNLGANARAALITRGLVEMRRLCDAMGADKNTVMSLAGIGDLILTCTDNQSRNRRFGQAIGKGDDVATAQKNIAQSVEGLYNVKQINELAQRYNVAMPITHQVYRILFESADPQTVVSELLLCSSKVE